LTMCHAQPLTTSVRPGRSARRRGMTLLELMLVLALIVMIGALSLPAMRGPFANFQLRKAGDLVRVQWTKARIRAMKTGQIQMFRFVPGESTFSIEPYYTEQDYLEGDLRNSSMGPIGAGTAPPLSSESRVPIDPSMTAPGIQTDKNRKLPDGVILVGGIVKSDTRSVQIEQETQGTLAMETGGSEPIMFYPDGTTSDAEVSLSNQQTMYVRVTLRGLTGTAKVSPLMTAEEWQQVEQAIQTSTELQ